MKAIILAVSFIAVFSFMSGKYIFINSSPDDSIMGVSHSLACPCECPMVLEDCHMSCGLQWKDQIGLKLKSGLVKADIVSYFYKRYGSEAMLTPAQRLAGKWYEVSRGGYPVKDMVIFSLIVLIWTALLYTGLLMAQEKLASLKGKRS